MEVVVKIPEEFEDELKKAFPGGVAARALELLAIDAYRKGIFSSAEVGLILNHKSRMETENFLQAEQVPLCYSAEDLKADLQVLREAFSTECRK